MNKSTLPIQRVVIGSGIGIAALYWLLHDVSWQEILNSVQHANIYYLLLGFGFMVCSQLSRSIRWYIIVNESFTAKFSAVYASTQIGLLTNFLIPARLGELIRAYLLAKSSNIFVSQSLATIVVDKAFDLLVVLLALAFLSFFISSYGQLSIPAFLTGTDSAVTISSELLHYTFLTVGAAFSISLILIGILYTRHAKLSKHLQNYLFFLPATWIKTLSAFIDRIVSGLHVLRSKKPLSLVLIWSLIVWFLNYIAVYLVLMAILGNISFMAPFVVITLVAIFISFPVVPGVVGQYHIGVISGLLFFYPDMPKEQLVSIALVIHSITLVTVTILGAGALMHERINLISSVSAAKGEKDAMKNV